MKIKMSEVNKKRYIGEINMKKNESGFPDYNELRLKLDLDNNERLQK